MVSDIFQVLFLCPHGAAKSVLAAAYFNQMAARRGLRFEARSAGTEPDPLVSSPVAALLAGQGVDVSGHRPVKLTQELLQEADLVVSLGCDLAAYAPTPTAVETWLEIPMPGKDLSGAGRIIFSKVNDLLERLEASSSVGRYLQ